MSGKRPDLNQILRDLEKEYGGKIMLSPRLIERIRNQASGSDAPSSGRACGNDDQVCVMCDTGRDVCITCDWGDWTCGLSAPDKV